MGQRGIQGCVREINVESITNTWFDMREAGLGQVPQESKGTLSYFRHRILGQKRQRDEEKCEHAPSAQPNEAWNGRIHHQD